MINLVALSLVMASLAGAGTIVKEGHRVVVVEYDQDGHHNTKISITPDQPLHAPKELICDAYGKCKHKIADAMGRAKDTKAKDTLKGAKEVSETVADSVGKAKETVSHRTHYVQEKAKDTLKEAKDTGNTLRKDVSSNVSEAVKNVGSYIGSKETLDNVMSAANLMGFATAYGLCVWVTFVSSHVLSRAMPRQQFGVVQSKIYPVYFRTMAYSVGLALLGHVLRHRKTVFFSKAEMFQVFNLLASLLTLFVNSMYLEPRATKVMFERMKIEKEEGRGRGDLTSELGKGNQHTTGEHDVVRSRIIRLNDKLKRLNSHSSLLNILNLMSLTWHLVYLAQCLHHNC
ncbi:transmembrane protein 205-like [Neltuma alba]|uniref:transmembrane protein 205-like n=1 Tax=Neltuma alba TaxID=207710 RepID=UPI0010A3613D|nr:transmembrane protein 205-like [Prosopis alba]